ANELADDLEVTQRGDVRADVSAEGDRLGGCAAAGVAYELAVRFGEAVHVGRMRGVVRHAHEVRLAEVVDFGTFEQVEQLVEHQPPIVTQQGRPLRDASGDAVNS